MVDDGGTPKSLRHAIVLPVTTSPMKELFERTELSVRDFMAQKFQAALLEAGDDVKANELLANLWRNLTGKDL